MDNEVFSWMRNQLFDLMDHSVNVTFGGSIRMQDDITIISGPRHTGKISLIVLHR